MNKAELILKVMSKMDIDEEAAEEALAALADGVVEMLMADRRPVMVGFGSFRLADRKARVIRHPRTGEYIDALPFKTVRFRSGTALKKFIKGG
jgi:DNA-binding protein HU-alpha